ncbi:E3 SUMO-protein ligase RanBP2-like [Schistocerca gregaria]|uniref:E3 SUMO-protein ligase RanBP2-like n=1 Tax=Schistocerca gregaria TaxID=7010 RepID=UPI00211EEF6F|nr:E3 SUMO-protein ligase RanBP2-like [Schistocerca gregaria]
MSEPDSHARPASKKRGPTSSVSPEDEFSDPQPVKSSEPKWQRASKEELEKREIITLKKKKTPASDASQEAPSAPGGQAAASAPEKTLDSEHASTEPTAESKTEKDRRPKGDQAPSESENKADDSKKDLLGKKDTNQSEKSPFTLNASTFPSLSSSFLANPMANVKSEYVFGKNFDPSSISPSPSLSTPIQQSPPTIPAEGSAAVRTGEEDDVNLFESEIKLSQYIKEDSKWLDLGYCVLRINENKNANAMFRILVRSDRTLKLLVNSVIIKNLPYKINEKVPTCLRFFAFSSASDASLVLYTARFRKAEDASASLEIIQKCLEKMNASSSISQEPASKSDTKVEPKSESNPESKPESGTDAPTEETKADQDQEAHVKN